MKDKTGGPAFPVPNDANVNDQEGMTLRDYFAAKAMQGLLNSAGAKDGMWHIEAKGAYEIADAMLAERAK